MHGSKYTSVCILGMKHLASPTKNTMNRTTLRERKERLVKCSNLEFLRILSAVFLDWTSSRFNTQAQIRTHWQPNYDRSAHRIRHKWWPKNINHKQPPTITCKPLHRVTWRGCQMRLPQHSTKKDKIKSPNRKNKPQKCALLISKYYHRCHIVGDSQTTQALENLMRSFATCK